jgi:hypothetical protein
MGMSPRSAGPSPTKPPPKPSDSLRAVFAVPSEFTSDDRYPPVPSREHDRQMLAAISERHRERTAYLIELQKAQHRQFLAKAEARKDLEKRFFKEQAKIVVPSSLESAVKARDLLLTEDEVDWEAYERAAEAVLRLSPAEPDQIHVRETLGRQIARIVVPLMGLLLVLYATLCAQTDPTLVIVGAGLLGAPVFWERVVEPEPETAMIVAVLLVLVCGLGAAIHYSGASTDVYVKERQAAYSRQIRDYKARQAAQLELLRQYDESRPEGRLP